MSLINRAVLLYSNKLLKAVDASRRNPEQCQRDTFKYLLKNGSDSLFGYEHGLNSVVNGGYSYEEFRKKVPVRDYNQIQPYIEKLRNGEDYVLWNQKVKWFAKSSGTSSDKSKFIPVTPDALSGCHYTGFKTMLASYLDINPHSKMLGGKSMTLGGSIRIDNALRTENPHSQTYSGDLSAILLNNSPRIAELKRVPSRETALMPSFEEKIARICKECSRQNVTNFSGVPSWNLIMIRSLLEYNRVKYLTDIWPNIELFMHGGISFDPYRAQYEALIPSDKMHYLENYNASEGYFAFQDVLNDRGMLLTLSNGVFYEFVPMDNENGEPVPLDGVKVGKQYALVITTNSGLWRYKIGDCVEFTSINPYKVIITGRTQMFINTFGEELMIGNAQEALSAACKACNVKVEEYMVAPIFMEKGRRGAHQWVVEMSVEDAAKQQSFACVLDEELCKCNSDYEAKRTESETMDPLVLTVVPEGTFYKWMSSRGKVGGQNKVPRLSSDRKHIEELLLFNNL